MNVIHTYVDSHGIIWKELLYTQYLSAILAKKHYGKIDFYGDPKTSKLVKDLKLPYDNINDTLLSIDDVTTWSLPKLKVFKEQTQPFLHIDTDTLIFSKIDFDSFDKEYLFSHQDMSFGVDESIRKNKVLKDLYMTWFVGLENKIDFDFDEKYPLRDMSSKFKNFVPESIIKKSQDAYKNYYFVNKTYTNLFFDLLENLGKEILDNVHFSSIPNMNITYVKNYNNFSFAAAEAIKHYIQHKERIDKETYGSCYIEQLMVHTQLRLLDKKYKKESKKLKNFIFPSLPFIQMDDYNNVQNVEELKFPLRLKYNNNKHFECGCCGEKIISGLSKVNCDDHNLIYELKDMDDITEFLKQDFNGFLHLTYLKWYDIFQVYVIDKLRKEIGDEKIREIHSYFAKLYPSKNLAKISTGEKLYTKLTGFSFTNPIKK